MGKLIVNRLRLNQLYVGYRVEAIKSNGSSVLFDMEDGLLKPFLRLFTTTDVSQGSVIDGRVVNGLFVTDNEENVFEVETISAAEALVGKYFLCSPKYMTEDEYKEYLRSLITYSRPNLKSYEYGYFGDVPNLYSLLVKASQGVKCNILADVQQNVGEGSFSFEVAFIDFREELSFVHNLLSLLNRKVWNPEVSILGSDEEDRDLKRYRIPYLSDKTMFVENVLYKFGILGRQEIFQEDVSVFGEDDFGRLSCCDSRSEDEIEGTGESPIFHSLRYTVAIPGYDGNTEDLNTEKNRLKWLTPLKEKPKKSTPVGKLSVSRSKELITSFVSHTFKGNMMLAFSEMLNKGFNANELAGRFGFTKEIYRDWIETASAEDIVKARKSLEEGKVKISTDRYKKLLNIVIDYVHSCENSSTAIKTLKIIGFTANELVDVFGLNKDDVESFYC